MNERIRELAEQADIKFSAHWQHQGIDTAVIIPSDLKNFAELIVRECMRICEVAEIGHVSHGAFKEASGCIAAKEYIADWFEVEK